MDHDVDEGVLDAHLGQSGRLRYGVLGRHTSARRHHGLDSRSIRRFHARLSQQTRCFLGSGLYKLMGT